MKLLKPLTKSKSKFHALHGWPKEDLPDSSYSYMYNPTTNEAAHNLYLQAAQKFEAELFERLKQEEELKSSTYQELENALTVSRDWEDGALWKQGQRDPGWAQLYLLLRRSMEVTPELVQEMRRTCAMILEHAKGVDLFGTSESTHPLLDPANLYGHYFTDDPKPPKGRARLFTLNDYWEVCEWVESGDEAVGELPGEGKSSSGKYGWQWLKKGRSGWRPTSLGSPRSPSYNSLQRLLSEFSAATPLTNTAPTRTRTSRTASTSNPQIPRVKAKGKEVGEGKGKGKVSTVAGDLDIEPTHVNAFDSQDNPWQPSSDQSVPFVSHETPVASGALGATDSDWAADMYQGGSSSAEAATRVDMDPWGNSSGGLDAAISSWNAHYQHLGQNDAPVEEFAGDFERLTVEDPEGQSAHARGSTS